MRKVILLIFLTTVVTGMLYYQKYQWSNYMSDELKVAFPYAKPARFYEPTQIHLSPEYSFLENIFSTLVELSPEDASVQKGIAESWEWVNDELVFTIRKDIKTAAGVHLTAEDAEFSLKRVLVKTQNTHGNLKDLVCSAAIIKSIDDTCEGIRSVGNKLFLKISGKSAFILPMLSGIDFAIIPKLSVDIKTLDIIDYRNTSGPYYVEKDSEDGKIELIANQNHYHYSKEMPQKIILVPTDPNNKSEAIGLFKKGLVDLLTTVDAARTEEMFYLNKEISNSNLHVTANIRSYQLVFTERGIQELNLEQRIALGRQIKSTVNKVFLELPGYELSNQFYPPYGSGAIDPGRAESYATRTGTLKNLTAKKILISIIRLGNIDIYKNAIEKDLPIAQVTEGKKSPTFEKYNNIDDMPHAIIAGPDSGFNEDISLISYSLAAGEFGLSTKERELWLSEYVMIPNKESRLKKLKELHEKALASAILIPMFSGPYTALVRAPWTFHFSKIMANDPIWRIKKN